MSQSIEFLSSVGRIVWGHPLTSTIKTDQDTNLPVMRDGKEVEQWVFGLAIEKSAFLANEWPNMQKAANMVFPHGTPSNFSWKYKDGDGVNSAGKPYNQKEGWAGCYVLTIATESYAPQVFKRESNGQFRQLAAHEVKKGDFVRVTLNLKANQPSNPKQTPGLYVNPRGIEFVGYGQEIISGGIDPDEAFATPVAQLPQGASLTPLAPTSGAMPPNMMHNAPQGQPQGYNSQAQGMMPQAQPQSMPQQQNYAPQAQPMPQAAPQGMPPPHNEFIQNAGVPQQNYAPQAQPMPQAAPQAMPMGNVAQPAAGGYPAQQNYAGQPAPTATPSLTNGMPQGMPNGMPQR